MKQLISIIAYGAFNFVSKKDGNSFTIYYVSLFISTPFYFYFLCIILFYFKRQGKVVDLLEIINNYTLIGAILFFSIVGIVNIYLRSINLIDKIEKWRNGPGRDISMSKINLITFLFVALSYLLLLIVAGF